MEQVFTIPGGDEPSDGRMSCRYALCTDNNKVPRISAMKGGKRKKIFILRWKNVKWHFSG